MLRLYRNHSAPLDSLHTPTQPYTTTYQPYSTHWDQLVVVAGSEITSDSGSTYGLDTVFSTPSSSGLFRCCLFAGFILSIVCLLAGISLLHVPRRLRKVRDSNPRAISDSRVSGAVLSASQPTFPASSFALRFYRNIYPTTALHLKSSISPDANSR